jgi:hypothetical protein
VTHSSSTTSRPSLTGNSQWRVQKTVRKKLGMEPCSAGNVCEWVLCGLKPSKSRPGRNQRHSDTLRSKNFPSHSHEFHLVLCGVFKKKKLWPKIQAWNPVLAEMFVTGSLAETSVTATHCSPKISLRTAMNFT